VSFPPAIGKSKSEPSLPKSGSLDAVPNDRMVEETVKLGLILTDIRAVCIVWCKLGKHPTKPTKYIVQEVSKIMPWQLNASQKIIDGATDLLSHIPGPVFTIGGTKANSTEEWAHIAYFVSYQEGLASEDFEGVDYCQWLDDDA